MRLCVLALYSIHYDSDSDGNLQEPSMVQGNLLLDMIVASLTVSMRTYCVTGILTEKGDDCLLSGKAPVNNKLAAGDKGGLVRSQIHDAPGDVGRQSEPS